VTVLQGELVLKSKAQNGSEKNVYHQSENQLGLWTDVAGNRSTYLVVGDDVEFSNAETDAVTVHSNSGKVTIALMPVADETPDTAMINRFGQFATNEIDEVVVSYDVNSQTQAVTVTQNYLDNGQPVETMIGLLPLQWKNAVGSVTSFDKVRSARGITKFTSGQSFSYEIPFVGVLPSLPVQTNSYDTAKLVELIQAFIAQGPSVWNDKSDTYWAGKNYGKVSELAALAHSHGLTQEHETLVNWLKAELEDWFTATTNGEPDKTRYFSYDSEWNTVLGYDESFGAQQQLNDHHFHYGYFVRAAAEICRTDKSWCASDAWGGMVNMLIRDYAATRNDALFPYARNFDPANGFSWASGHANFALGNNNESTSEAANAYGAIVLYGLITENQAMTDHGIYLHASSAATYWEYWNNLDRYEGLTGDYDNFLPEYDKMTTSIIWGHGHVFSTWFSGAYAHILGIQGLPLNPLVMHIGQHADYLKDYVTLGLSESSNGKPSGLPLDNWRDVWWNILAMTDPEAAIADFNTMNFDYDVEAGETIPHTYHWIHSFAKLGHLRSGQGDITADYPSALVFDKNGLLTYVAYNYSNQQRLVSYSDGMALCVAPNSFAQKTSSDAPDTCAVDNENPTQPGSINSTNVTSTSATLTWGASADNVAVSHYEISVSGNVVKSLTSTVTSVSVTGLVADSVYSVALLAVDFAGNKSAVRTETLTTLSNGEDELPTSPSNIVVTNVGSSTATLSWNAGTDDIGVEGYRVEVLQNGTSVETLTSAETAVELTGLSAGTAYAIDVFTIDTAQQASTNSAKASFSTTSVSTCSDFCLVEQGSSLVFTVKTGQFADIHYKKNNGGQQNIRMITTGNEHVYTLSNLQEGDSIDYFFTVVDGLAMDTTWANHSFGGTVLVDTQAPTSPGNVVVSNITHNSALLSWAASTDNVAVDYYEVSVSGLGDFISMTNSLSLSNLTASSQYSVSVVAVDASNNISSARESSFITSDQVINPPCTDVCINSVSASTAQVQVNAGGIADIHYTVNNGGQINVRMNVVDGLHEFNVTNLTSGDVVDFFVTVIDGPAYDTAWMSYVFAP
jgi:chitodextrinase